MSIHRLALDVDVNFMWSLFLIIYVYVSVTGMAKVLLENGRNISKNVATNYRFDNLKQLGWHMQSLWIPALRLNIDFET